jgi:type IV pilus assembly protein PilY1
MKRIRAISFAFAALTGVAAGLPLTIHADDTDIYLTTGAVTSGVRANILFVLDTSGSMTNTDGTSPPVTRLDRMKQGLHEILDLANNVNVGLMRFHHRGGPVLYPVANINAPAVTVEDLFDPGAISNVTVRLSDPTDDADENALGVVRLDGIRSNVGDTTAGTETPLEVPVSVGGDDVEESLATGALAPANAVLEFERAGDEQIIGLRFSSVTVPAGALIVSAEIEFEVAALKTGAESTIDLDVWGESAVGARGAFSAADLPSARTKTTTTADWDDTANPDAGDKLVSADLSGIVQEIVDHGSWADGQAMVFILQKDSAINPSGNRTLKSFNTSFSVAPRLHIRYVNSAVSNNRKMGLRFQSVLIPQGATITKAEIEFTAGNVNTEATDIRIVGNDADNAVPFTGGATSSISGRVETTADADWNAASTPALTTWDATEVAHVTPDLTAIVQEIVNRGGWCGGNHMAFKLEANAASVGKRSVFTADGDSAKAPVLRVSYNATAPEPGASLCSLTTLAAQPVASADDAEERIADGNMDLVSAGLDLGTDSSAAEQAVGIRFPKMTIPRGAEIVSADIEFTVDKVTSDPTSLTFKGELSADAAPFASTDDNITSRATTASTVSWDGASTPPMASWDTPRDTFRSPDLSAIVQEIVAGGGWTAGNNMAFIITGSGRRAAISQADATGAPRLRITYKGPVTEAVITVRDRLHKIVDELEHRSGTPILGAMTEAAHYYRGEEVFYGRQRGTKSDADKVTRVSHPASYQGDDSTEVSRPAACTDSDLSATACKNEVINGTAVYKSPITNACQESYIILLSDGLGYITSSETGAADPRPQVDTIIGTDCGTDHDECAADLSGYLHSNDQITSATQVLAEGTAPLDDDQRVHTYTIGFNLSGDPTFLKDIASAGGGEFRDAASADELATVFKDFFGKIVKRTTSLAAPSLTVNAFNRLFSREEVYFSVFQPERQVRWRGNLKKYRLCTKDDAVGDPPACVLGEVIDANGDPAVGVDSQILTDAKSIWSTEDDGREILKGGAGAIVPDYRDRIFYTDLGLTDHPPIPVSLAPDEQKITIDNTAVRDEACADGSIGNPACDDLIEWILGRNVAGEVIDGVTPENRWRMSDPLHSAAVVITYGGDSATPIEMLLVSTNDGSLHMINAETGVEEWVFMPQVMLAKQRTLLDNPEGEHIDGLDGSPALRINDVDNDGVIEPADGDFVHMYIGMRRGGRNLYALDLTPSTVLTRFPDGKTDPTIVPKLLWRIEGGNVDPFTGDFSRLGQTWSRPLVASILVDNGSGGSERRTVLLFGGGYDASLDTGFGTDPTGGAANLGNAIYIVDANDGTLIHGISGDPDAHIPVPGMDFSIASDLAAFDSNGDGAIDRIYVVDTRGNLWRVDLGRKLSPTDAGGTVVGKLAELSDPAALADQRRVFEPPDVVQVLDSEFFSGSPPRYDLVVVVSGNRPDPLATTVADRVHAVRDLSVAGLTGDADHLAVDYPLPSGPLTEANLIDVTDNVIQDGDAAAQASAIVALRTSRGWFLRFEDVGEKGLAAPLVIAGKLFFTTFLPEASLAACAAQEGSGRLYGIDLLTAVSIFNWDGSPDADPLSVTDRTFALGSGIPSSASPIFLPGHIGLLIGGGSIEEIDPGITLPRKRTYWFQENQ